MKTKVKRQIIPSSGWYNINAYCNIIFYIAGENEQKRNILVNCVQISCMQI